MRSSSAPHQSYIERAGIGAANFATRTAREMPPPPKLFAAKRIVGDSACSGFRWSSGTLATTNRFLVPGAAWVAPTIVGAVLGPLVLLHDLGPILGRLVFYVIWQAGFAAALASALPSRASTRAISDQSIEPASG